MAVYNPFYVPDASQSPYLRSLGNVGGSYDSLFSGSQKPLVDASGNFINAAQGAIGPSEFDPTVSGLLQTSRQPVNNEMEDYFFQKYMTDANNRVANRGLIGQGAGEGLLNDASKSYSFGRADTALQRSLAAAQGANQLRTGQVGRAASLMGAGLSPYDTLRGLLTGQGNLYGNAAGLGGQVDMSNARNQTYGNLAAFNQFAPVVGSAARGGYDAIFGAPSDASTAASRDAGLTSSGGEQPFTDGGGDSAPDITGDFTWAEGGRIPGRGAYDHVKAILTPQEYVIRRPVAVQAKGALDRLNAGDFGGAARKLARTASVAR